MPHPRVRRRGALAKSPLASPCGRMSHGGPSSILPLMRAVRAFSIGSKRTAFSIGVGTIAVLVSTIVAGACTSSDESPADGDYFETVRVLRNQLDFRQEESPLAGQRGGEFDPSFDAERVLRLSKAAAVEEFVDMLHDETPPDDAADEQSGTRNGWRPTEGTHISLTREFDEIYRVSED